MTEKKGRNVLRKRNQMMNLSMQMIATAKRKKIGRRRKKTEIESIGNGTMIPLMMLVRTGMTIERDVPVNGTMTLLM